MTKEEKKEKDRLYYLANKEKIKIRQTEYRNSEKGKLVLAEYRNSEKYKKSHSNAKKKHRKANKEKLALYQKEYCKNNREKRREWDRIWRTKNRQTNPVYRLRTNVSSLIRQVFKNKGYRKGSKTSEILGCSFEEFKVHIESQWESWMTWDNYGLYNGEPNHGWDIDHITPSSSALTEDDVYKLNHYTNLKPLCSKINRDIKKNKIFV